MWVKICGVRDVATAEWVAALRPDAIGLNFYSGSPRCTSEDVARDIVGRLPAGVEPVAVFVNTPADAIGRICRNCGIRTVQLHGDETPDLAAALAGFDLIRAFRIAESLAPVDDELAELAERGVRLRACLVESRVQGAYGGTGHALAWDRLGAAWHDRPRPPLLLAGGLTPDNVSAALRAAHPWGADVASGVESSPGVKDRLKVEAFIARCRNLPG